MSDDKESVEEQDSKELMQEDHNKQHNNRMIEYTAKNMRATLWSPVATLPRCSLTPHVVLPMVTTSHIRQTLCSLHKEFVVL